MHLNGAKPLSEPILEYCLLIDCNKCFYGNKIPLTEKLKKGALVPPTPVLSIHGDLVPPTPVLSIHGALVPPHPTSVCSWGFSAPHPSSVHSWGFSAPHPSSVHSWGFSAPPPPPLLSVHGALVPPHPSSVHSWGFGAPHPSSVHSWGFSAPHPVLSIHNDLGGHFKNAYELVNLRALKSSLLNKLQIFQCIGKIFCVEFQRVPLKFHTKYLTYTVKDTIFIQCSTFKIALRFTSLYVSLNPPPNSPWDL